MSPGSGADVDGEPAMGTELGIQFRLEALELLWTIPRTIPLQPQNSSAPLQFSILGVTEPLNLPFNFPVPYTTTSSQALSKLTV